MGKPGLMSRIHSKWVQFLGNQRAKKIHKQRLQALEQELNAEEEEEYIYVDDTNDPDMKRITAEVELEYQINLLKRITQEPFAEALELYGQWQRGAAEDTPAEFWEDFAALQNQFAASGDHYSFIKMQIQHAEYLRLTQQVYMLFSPDAIASHIRQSTLHLK